MRTPRTALTTAALTACVALALTACGSDDGKSSDTIEGAGDAKKSSSPSPASTKAVDGVDLTLPKDMKLVFDFEAPADAELAAAQRDAANFVRSLYRGVAEQSAKDPALPFYARGDALEYQHYQVRQSVDDGKTASGTRRHYRAETEKSGNGSVAVSFCMDQTEFYSKDVASGEVSRTDPSDADFMFYRVLMAEYPGQRGVWQATAVDIKGEAKECKE